MASVLRLLAGTFTGGTFGIAAGNIMSTGKVSLATTSPVRPSAEWPAAESLLPVLACTGLGARPLLRPFVMPANGFQNWDYSPSGATGDAVAFSITTTPTLKVARRCLASRGLAGVRAHWRAHSSKSECVGGTVGGRSCACAQLSDTTCHCDAHFECCGRRSSRSSTCLHRWSCRPTVAQRTTTSASCSSSLSITRSSPTAKAYVIEVLLKRFN